MIDREGLPSILKSCRIFSGLPAAEIEQLCRLAQIQRRERNTLLFSEGEAAEGFFIVVSGRVKIYKLSAEGKERILHIVPPGDTFAEAAIFGDGRYPAFAETLVASELLFLPGRDFLELLHRHSGIAINMIAALSHFLRQFTHQIEELTFKDVPARLAGYLLQLEVDAEDCCSLPVNKGQLASKLGTVSETLSRSLRKLADEGLIQVDGKRVKILERELLAALAATEKGE